MPRRRENPVGTLTPRERALLLVVTFLSFAPIGALLALLNAPVWGLGGALYGVVISGSFGVLWASCFMFRRYWLIPFVLAGQVLLPWRIAAWLTPTGVLRIGQDWPERDRIVIATIIAGGLMILAYVSMILVTRRIEARAARSAAELDVAAQMHRSIVPGIDLSAGGVRVLGSSSPSTEMGGDLVDAVVTGSRVDVFLADVAGHGVRAGVLMAMLKSSLRTLLLDDRPLDDVLRLANRAILQVNEPGMFITAAAMRIQPGQSASYALAGHLPILRFEAATRRVIDLPNEYLPLGITGDEAFEARTTPADRGDLFVLLTDGLMEVMNARGEQLGLPRLRELVATHAPGDDRAVFDAIMSAVADHGPRSDDQSLILIRVL